MIRGGKTIGKLASKQWWNSEDWKLDRAATDREDTSESRAAVAMFQGQFNLAWRSRKTRC
ncbi:MAG TPA: hypothetical protein DDZ51_17050 [Planctomycetaceae bacterium]|nr:hypothetical protein [Planctomycetaceae bacterium]